MKNQDQENKFYNLTAQETNPPVTPNNNAPFPSPMPVTPNNQPTTLEEGTSPLPTFSMPSGPFFSETTVTEPTFTPTPIGKAYIRFLHSAPGSPAVDIYVNNSLIARNINYNDFTEYFTALQIGRAHV